MAMNQVQFQSGLSMAQFIQRYGTEAKMALIDWDTQGHGRLEF